MVWGVLPLLTYIGLGSGVLLFVVSLAAGLYYLAELIEVLAFKEPKTQKNNSKDMAGIHCSSKKAY